MQKSDFLPTDLKVVILFFQIFFVSTISLILLVSNFMKNNSLYRLVLDLFIGNIFSQHQKKMTIYQIV
jgi:hypothetical protein